MRWIFFVLLGANILLFGWHMLLAPNVGTRQSAASTSSPARFDAPSIQLLQDSEPKASVSGTLPAQTPMVEPVEEADPSAALCTLVGPFDEVPVAEQFVERLAAMGVQGDVAKVDIPAGPGYWVHLSPSESRREALRRLAELQAQGVDSYVIPRGELANGISLGMFSKEALARARMQEVAELGIAPELHVIERSYQEIWVSIPAAKAINLGEQAWSRLFEGQKNVERKQNFCLRVASRDNFH